MTLEQHLGLLAAAIREKINTIMPRLIPAGGTPNQVLTKTGAGNFATGWQDAPAGGGGGSTNIDGGNAASVPAFNVDGGGAAA